MVSSMHRWPVPAVVARLGLATACKRAAPSQTVVR
jgi:hypothetical protein